MQRIGELWRRVLFLFRRHQFDRDLEEEMRFHLDRKAEQNREAGGAAETARYTAVRQFGNATLLREASREQWGWSAAEGFVRDLKYAWRALRCAPGFTAVALLTLAAGVGVNTAMFSVLRAVILQPLPYREPDRLMMVWQLYQRVDEHPQSAPQRRRTPPAGTFKQWRERSRSFESLAGFAGQYMNLTGSGDAERIIALHVTADFFPTLGVGPARGRNFVAEEEGGRTAILSDGLWRNRFGADPAILGKPVQLDGQTYSVVGVLPAGFQPLLPTTGSHIDLYLPSFEVKSDERAMPMRVVGRLRDGVGPSAAEWEIAAITAGLPSDNAPGDRDSGVLVVPVASDLTRDARPALMALIGAVSCLLLIVCVNLAALMLARSAARQRETGIRAALGAGRWRLARQLLAEALLVGVLGGAAGTALARWIVELICALHPGGLPRIEQAVPDAVVFAFGLGISVVAGLVFGALPAIAASRTASDSILRARGFYRGSGRLRGVLVAAEVALALVMVTGAGLLLRSYVLLKAVAPGFSEDRVVTMQIWFPELKYNEARRSEFLKEVLDRVRGLPSVEAAGAVSSLPLAYEALMSTDVSIKGHPEETVDTFGVTPGYFQAAGISLVAGRFLKESDQHAVLLNEAFLKRYNLETSRVVGEQIALYGKHRTVVGIVRDIRDRNLQTAGGPEAFLPYPDLPTPWAGLAVRTSSDPLKLVPAIRAEIRAVDPDQPIGRVQTMKQVLSREMARPRFNLILLGTFAGIAMGLAAIGVYGVIAYLVSQRKGEIGVRMALGAQRTAVVRYVLARGMAPVAVGVMLGIAGSFAATRVLRTLLYGVGTNDPVTLILAVALLAAVALSACLLPAHRATRIDPMEALRCE